jgi:tRNA-modifying protein YgfZ
MDPSGLLEEDYSRIRSSAAIVPYRREFVRIWGPDAISYLQGQCSQDVESLSVGGSAEALLLEPQGKVDAYVRVIRLGEDELTLDTDDGFADVVLERLRRFKLRVKVEMERLHWDCLAVRGPRAEALDSGDQLRVEVHWPGLVGFDLVGESPRLPDVAGPVGDAAWEAVRIEAGIPLMGSEIDQRTIPEEAGLVERCVSFTKGCFTGQELVARIDARGSNVARRLRGLVVPGATTRERSLVGGEELFLPDAGSKPAGRVTSVSWSPGMGATVALAYVQRNVGVPGDLCSGELSVQVRPLPLVG